MGRFGKRNIDASLAFATAEGMWATAMPIISFVTMLGTYFVWLSNNTSTLLSSTMWQNLAEGYSNQANSLKQLGQLDDPCNYSTDRDGNICFSMDDILPILIRKLTSQGDLIMHKDGPQFIMVNAEKNSAGEVFLQLNVKDSNVKEISLTKH